MEADQINMVADIIQRYNNIEIELENKLSQLENDEKNLMLGAPNGPTAEKNFCSTLESAKLRNKELLKSLEITKATLRSRAAYSPTEDLIEAATRQYLARPSLVPVVKKLYGPTFV